MKYFFTSDLHISHKKICEFTQRPWNQEENTQKIIDIWNSQVGKKDIVVDAGDFFFNFKARVNDLSIASEFLNKVNGNIIHVMGNHDYRAFWKVLAPMFPNKIIGFYDRYEMRIQKQKVVIDHYPGYTWNNSHNGSILLHGHEHGELQGPGRQLDVGIDESHTKRPRGLYGFWTEDEIIKYLANKPIFNPRKREPR